MCGWSRVFLLLMAPFLWGLSVLPAVHGVVPLRMRQAAGAGLLV